LVTADVALDEGTPLLERHATTLDLLRRATDKPGCRFERDWSRPAFDMLLPEVQQLRNAARLLAVAARQAAADGDGEQALADVVRIHRLGVLVAATRARLAGTSLAESLVPEALPALPGDRFTADKPLLAKRTDDGWVVYSVGPDGEDDGGPPAASADRADGNDDEGLRLAVRQR
jgi:hypothetical protein